MFVFVTPGVIPGAVIGVATKSDPIGAKGFGLPWFPSPSILILESCSELKAGSEKISSLIFMSFTFKSMDKNSFPPIQPNFYACYNYSQY